VSRGEGRRATPTLYEWKEGGDLFSKRKKESVRAQDDRVFSPRKEEDLLSETTPGLRGIEIDVSGPSASR